MLRCTRLSRRVSLGHRFALPILQLVATGPFLLEFRARLSGHRGGRSGYRAILRRGFGWRHCGSLDLLGFFKRRARIAWDGSSIDLDLAADRIELSIRAAGKRETWRAMRDARRGGGVCPFVLPHLAVACLERSDLGGFNSSEG